MRIGIDVCTWSNRRGYGRFTRGIVTALASDHPEHQYVLIADRQTAEQYRFPTAAEINVVNTSAQATQAASSDGARSPVDLWRLSGAVARLDVDAFFFPTHYSFFPMLRRVPTVVAFHDATAEQYPGMIFRGLRARLFWTAKTRLALRQADRVVTVSSDARRQLARSLGCDETDVVVVTEGPDPLFRPRGEPDAAIRARYALPTDIPLVLYVGGISPHKNLSRLVRAMAILDGRSAVPWHLVLVGDHENDAFLGCYDEVAALTHDLGLGHRVTFTGFVPDTDLALLYNAAAMLVLPSLNEGFGLPVVEAMASGLPVAVSDRGSLPEVVGSAGVTFDPMDPQAIAAAVRQLLEDEGLRAELARRSRERAAEFSWRRGAGTLVRLLEELPTRQDRSSQTNEIRS